MGSAQSKEAKYARAAKRGDADAMFNLALLLARDGKAAEDERTKDEGVEEDMPNAVALFRQAADLGHVGATLKLGTMLYRGDAGVERDVPEGMRLIRKAAERDHSDAVLWLGATLSFGDEGERDLPAAAEFLRRAVEHGSTDAMNLLGVMLLNGDGGVERDAPAARDLFLRAAQSGNAGGMSLLGLLLESGNEGVEMDIMAAGWWYLQGADLGDAAAMNSLGLRFLRADSLFERDVPTALSLFQCAAQLDNHSAMHNLACLFSRGIGVRRNVSYAVELLELSVRTCQQSANSTALAIMLLSEDVGAHRDPARAAELLEDALKLNPTYGPALHELAVLYASGADGVPRNRERAAFLYSVAASQASYNYNTFRSDRIIIEAGERYVEVVEEILQKASAKPKTCLLLTLGGGGRGKTSTVNSLRGMPFITRHIPTDMAELSRFVIQPGIRGMAGDVIAEYDFRENSLRANASRLYKEEVSKAELEQRDQCALFGAPLEVTQVHRSAERDTEQPHADVIERVRRSLLEDKFRDGFNGSVVQVWDLAGQSQYEMAHSMMVTRGCILIFVTDLTRVADERTRESEVKMLCYWMQLAHILVPDPSVTGVLVVGTRRGKCKDDTLGILKECLATQLASKVYDSWIRAHPSDGGGGNIPRFIAIENSDALQNPEYSGLEALERAVKALADEIVASRDEIPLRWLALVEKLERKHQNSTRIYFSRGDIRELSMGFPGFTKDERERDRDVLEGLRCLATMGRLVLFELGEKEWYVFMDVDRITDILGSVTAPEERLRDRLSAEDVLGLKKGMISRNALFDPWDGFEKEEKKVMLKLFCQFDLLMLLDEGGEGTDEGSAIIGVPALMTYGWDDFKWGRAAGEKDLVLKTRFAEAIPNGLIGTLIAHMHRVLGLKEPDVHATDPMTKVRANAALLRVRGGSRVFVGFKGAERELCWKFRGLHPILVARECIRRVEELLDNPVRFINVHRKHTVLFDCDSSRKGCGGSGTVEIELSRHWVFQESRNMLPTRTIFCKSCLRPWSSARGNSFWPRLSAWGIHGNILDNISTAMYGLLGWDECDSEISVGRMQPVMEPCRFDVFISHAGPDKLTLSEPLYRNLARQHVHTFLDKEGLRINEGTAPELMERAMEEARIGIFVLSPEFAARKWPLKELRSFLERDERCKEDGKFRPVLLPVFYRLSLCDCAEAVERIYGPESEHMDVLRKEGFFKRERQADCSTAEAALALQMLTRFSGVEVLRSGGGEELSSAAVVEEAVQRVLDYMRIKGLLP